MTVRPPLWTEVCTYRKKRRGKIWDTFRVFVNELGWCKAHSDKKGKDYYFESLDALLVMIQALRKIRYVQISGSLPTSITSRY